MVRRLLLGFLSSLLFTGCLQTVPGSELCEAAGVEISCGFDAATCQEALSADSTFSPANHYVDFSVSLDDRFHCILRASDVGGQEEILRNPLEDIEAGVDRVFDLGRAEPDGILVAADDPDNDGLTNQEELVSTGTDPEDADTDDDGVSDGLELEQGVNPLTPDSDGDGLIDGYELERGTDPLAIDSDGDGDPDGHEEDCGSSPLDSAFVCADHDEDADGLSDIAETDLGTDPDDADTDDDGLIDGLEIERGADPFNPDSDEDGLEDGVEESLGTDPVRADTDEDGLLDATEVSRGTDPTDADSDDDGDSDGAEEACGSSPLDSRFRCPA